METIGEQIKKAQGNTRKAPSGPKTSAIEVLGSHLDARIEQLEGEARDIVRQKMHVEARDRVRGAVAEELEEVANTPDFFGFSEIFEAIEVPSILPEVLE